MNTKQNHTPERLLSLDLFRGLVMFLLVAAGSGLYHTWLDATQEGTILHSLALQFQHHSWNGLRFWDLIQPFFMFIVGVAMPFSYAKRLKRGDSKRKITQHIIRRCALLLAFGVGLHVGYNHKLVWELWNVLSQLSMTILIAFFLMRYKWSTQIIASIGLLLLTEILYRTFSLEGYNQPFVKDHNFGSWMDMILMGKINPGGGWVTINFLPTAAHTIWGVVAGQLLMSERSGSKKIKALLIAALIALVAGYLLDWTSITPIIKRIATSSFVLASGGWALLTLAFFYWLVDIMGIKGWVRFFAIVGMNPIFIYVFMETAGKQWLRAFSAAFISDALVRLGTMETLAHFVNSLAVLAMAWGLCYWLYRRKIFIKI
jgi:predicted acyltransferase